jgi:hypothetical protein
MKSLTNILLKGAMLFALILLGQNLHAQSVSTSASPSDVTAIYILLQPDAAMLKHAEATNARLLKAYPKGFALDATHSPHITMLQCFVRTADLDKLYAAEEKVFAAANVNAMKLEAFKLYYIPAEVLAASAGSW